MFFLLGCFGGYVSQVISNRWLIVFYHSFLLILNQSGLHVANQQSVLSDNWGFLMMVSFRVSHRVSDQEKDLFVRSLHLVCLSCEKYGHKSDALWMSKLYSWKRNMVLKVWWTIRWWIGLRLYQPAGIKWVWKNYLACRPREEWSEEQ